MLNFSTPKIQYIICSREHVDPVNIILHAFQWKISSQSVLMQYNISMHCVCLKYVNEVEVGMQ